ncbi:hypothetical protein C8R44DRAFT_747154 [Mycena epipterygia]|nr:hypothetical protein C8R44DRAFT_747154 [Mycena epipterygia]
MSFIGFQGEVLSALNVHPSPKLSRFQVPNPTVCLLLFLASLHSSSISAFAFLYSPNILDIVRICDLASALYSFKSVAGAPDAMEEMYEWGEGPGPAPAIKHAGHANTHVALSTMYYDQVFRSKENLSAISVGEFLKLMNTWS